MSLLIGFLTFILVVNCLFLMLLILIQLPKKEAGAGIAFGGATTDALFGAGSGNALTRLTKYTASIFVGLSIVLSMLNMRAARDPSRRLERELSRQASAAPAVPTPGPAATMPPASTPPASTVHVQNVTLPVATNLTLQNVPQASTNLLTTPAQAQTPAAEAVEAPKQVPAAPANSPK
ncbi:MAG: preprotein translocase subunit SecG [Verrucomicrobiota bacterium]